MSALTAVADSLRMAFFMFWETLWALVLGFTLSGAVQAFASRREIERDLGGHAPLHVLRATLFGAASSSCSYAATAMAKSLFQKGADFVAAMTFMFASTNLVVELGIVIWLLLGWQFTVSEFLGGFVMIALFAALSRFVFRPKLIESARARLQAAEVLDTHEHSHGEQFQAQPWLRRARSLAGWSDAASYAIADITMLRTEMLIGYLVAGILAVIVPVSLWNHVFLTGHGFWTTLENVTVGPLIAIVSFVCSIGNVPLAAALWKGGISFGGVISFIFADLITFPLLLIYRKYYGWRLTVRLAAFSWFVMSLAGLIIELAFQGFGVVPTQRPTQIVEPAIHLNYTSVLNVIFLVVFAALAWMKRNQDRLGGGQGYAIDPICGMQVQMVNAVAQRQRAGQVHYFCSDHCGERFDHAHRDEPESTATKKPRRLVHR